MSTIYDWSLIAPENARADEIINWAEGQPPSSVNDSARAMMQRFREYLSDNGGAIDTQFVANSYEDITEIRLITKSPIAAYANDIVVRFKAQGTNRGETNIALNQLLAQPVYKTTQNGLETLTGGEIQEGGLYELVYHLGIGGDDKDGWCLTNPTFPQIFPSGFIATFAMKNVPTGWLLCDGKEYSREEYANLFAAIGGIWGIGDGTTTFNIPDLRGMFLRGLDSERGLDKGRVLGSRQEESFKAHTHQGTISENGGHAHKYLEPTKPYYSWTGQGGIHDYICGNREEKLTGASGQHSHTLTLKATGGPETRPVNIAVVYAIKV
ncbi:putative phage tail fiber protein [Bartonella australis AUST/NH1]|uniref:Putative phage tail fiber protein n=1 Tax=Bartonella australis (strain Aust/NH1) TaxID=1094489 RepID=M1NUL1_BARAA|nr:phage tail protein [Bartonella australis]AGF74953.1 putative phage tail fiber protein [Bartonella australis AUST/NH1]